MNECLCNFFSIQRKRQGGCGVMGRCEGMEAMLMSRGAVGRRLSLFSCPDISLSLPLTVPFTVTFPHRFPHVLPGGAFFNTFAHRTLLNPLPPAFPLSIALIIVPAAVGRNEGISGLETECLSILTIIIYVYQVFGFYYGHNTMPCFIK